MPQIFAEARFPATSPSGVVIVPLYDAAAPVTPPPARTIALARLSQPELTVWIRDAINAVLAERPLARDRPAGQLLERGRFRHRAEQVWVDDWYREGTGLLIARCADRETARRLAAVLDALLADTA